MKGKLWFMRSLCCIFLVCHQRALKNQQLTNWLILRVFQVSATYLCPFPQFPVMLSSIPIQTTNSSLFLQKIPPFENRKKDVFWYDVAGTIFFLVS